MLMSVTGYCFSSHAAEHCTGEVRVVGNEDKRKGEWTPKLAYWKIYRGHLSH